MNIVLYIYVYIYQETACTARFRCTDHLLNGPAVCRAKLYLHCMLFHGTTAWSQFTDLHGREIPAFPVARRCTDWMGSPPCMELHGN